MFIYIDIPNLVLLALCKAALMAEGLRSMNPDLGRHKYKFLIRYPHKMSRILQTYPTDAVFLVEALHPFHPKNFGNLNLAEQLLKVRVNIHKPNKKLTYNI